MPMDYEVFKPENEHLAKIIVRLLQQRGYNAGYQLGYPKNKIFIRVNTKEEANRISEFITGFMEKIKLAESEITFEELNRSINMPERTLTEAENAANLGTQAELEPEVPEPEEPMPEEIEAEPEETEVETKIELEPESETEPEESEPKSILEIEPEPEPKEPEPEQIPELEIEPEFEKPETVSELLPEPEAEEPETETILELEPEPEIPESGPIIEPETEPKEPELVQKKKKPEEEQFSFKTF